MLQEVSVTEECGREEGDKNKRAGAEGEKEG